MDEATHVDRTQRLDALFRAHGAAIVSHCGWRSDSAADAQQADEAILRTLVESITETP
jgi:hypothetical protein